MIRIEGKDAPAVQHLLEQASNYGARYVHIEQAINGSSTKAEQLSFFSTKQAANVYNFEQRTNLQQYGEVLPVQLLKDELQRKMELDAIIRSAGMPGRTMEIDPKQLLQQERARVEIFQETLTQQLRRDGLKPDIQQLQQHLQRDDPTFMLRGLKKEEGTGKPYLIRVEQNEHRAFVITAVGPELKQEQQKSAYMKSEVLEGSVKREEALSIMAKLQEEKEKGNRFVSFPSGKEGLVATDFVGAKTAFAALEKATEKTTDMEKQVVRSIRVVEIELVKLAEPKKEMIIADGKEDKKQKGVDLSR